MRRVSLVLLVAVVAALSFPTSSQAPTGDAGPTVDLLVGLEAGGFAVHPVPAAAADAEIARLEARPGVTYAERDVPFHATAVTPNDPSFGTQWGALKVGAPDAWTRTTGSPLTVIAIVDTGVDPADPDLAGRVLPGQDFVKDGRTGDPTGHGTTAARVAAAHGNDGVGMAGYCWQCRILPVRALGVSGGGTSATVSAGVRWAVDHGADIVNLSLAGATPSETLEQSVAYARSKGVFVVAAAGNRTVAGEDLSQPRFPAASPGVIGVVATDQSDLPYDWTYRGSWADVAGPGCVFDVNGDGQGQLEDACGTSFAAPAVSGALALAVSTHPHAPEGAIEAALTSTAAPVGGGAASSGRVDAAALVSSLDATMGLGGTSERVAGSSRVATAVALSRRARSSSGAVIVARADDYADALAAAPLAGKLGAPVLLTARDALAAEVAAEVQRLGATTAWLVGGTGALGAGVEDGLRAAGATDVRRLAGGSRYETAGAIAAQVGGSRAFLAQAGGWADAVAVSALSARTRTPILLVDRDRVPAATSAALTSLGVTSATAVGGVNVIGEGVLASLRTTGLAVDRLAGSTRYETSRAIALTSVAAGADRKITWMATGTDWPDALAAGPAAAADGGVLVLTSGTGLVPSVVTWMTHMQGPGSSRLVIVGGVASVSAGMFEQLTFLLS